MRCSIATLPRLQMPNRDGLTTAHGFMRRDGRPDTHNVACMKDCVAQVRLSSQMPDYARDEHGNLAEQSRCPRRHGHEPATAPVTGLDLAARLQHARRAMA